MGKRITNGSYSGYQRDGKILIIDDLVEVSEEIKNLSFEERERQIKILEKQGRKEREKIKERKKLLPI